MQHNDNNRFERTDDPLVERMFDDICNMKMGQLRLLSDLLCSRLSLRVIGSFANSLDALGQTPSIPVPEPRLGVRISWSGQGSKVDAIKAVRSQLALGLKESRDFVDALPTQLPDSDSQEQAEALAKAWRESGFEAELI